MSSSFTVPEPLFLDVALATERCGSVDALQGLLIMLEESLTRDIPRISELLADGDVRAANRVMHALKGFIPIFCVDSMCQHVARVEELSKHGDVQAVSAAYAVLKPDLELLLSEVVDYLNGPT